MYLHLDTARRMYCVCVAVFLVPRPSVNHLDSPPNDTAMLEQWAWWCTPRSLLTYLASRARDQL